MNDFQYVAGRDRRARPGLARKDFPIALDGNPAADQSQAVHQIGDGQTIGNFLNLAVDRNRHRAPKTALLR